MSLDAEALASFESLVLSQTPAAEPWKPVTDYSFEAREAIEGPHARLIMDTFKPHSILDVGCGPGHLLRMLKEAKRYWACTFEGVDKETMDLGRPLRVEQWDRCKLVICREVLEHLTIRQIRQAVTNLCTLSSKHVYVTTRFCQNPQHLLDVDTADDLDPTHISMLNQDFLRVLFVLEGFKRRADLEVALDHMKKGRVLVYERT